MRNKILKGYLLLVLIAGIATHWNGLLRGDIFNSIFGITASLLGWYLLLKFALWIYDRIVPKKSA